MGMRYRRSINLGGGTRLNLNKNSFSVSFGGKLGRVTLNSKGKKTTTIRTPIKGMSYVNTKSISSQGKNNYQVKPRKTLKTSKNMMLVTIFLGWLGVHRYASGQIWTGLLYTFTCGVFCLGWIRDIIVEVKAVATNG